MSPLSLSLSPPKPEPLRRRDVLLAAGGWVALAALPGVFRSAPAPSSHLDDFLLVSETIAGAPLDRRAALARLCLLLEADGRFGDHIQTLAWLVRRHPGLDAAGLAGLLNTDASAGLRDALARVVAAWSALPDAAPALTDARTVVAHRPDGVRQRCGHPSVRARRRAARSRRRQPGPTRRAARRKRRCSATRPAPRHPDRGDGAPARRASGCGRRSGRPPRARGTNVPGPHGGPAALRRSSPIPEGNRRGANWAPARSGKLPARRRAPPNHRRPAARRGAEAAPAWAGKATTKAGTRQHEGKRACILKVRSGALLSDESEMAARRRRVGQLSCAAQHGSHRGSACAGLSPPPAKNSIRRVNGPVTGCVIADDSFSGSMV